MNIGRITRLLLTNVPQSPLRRVSYVKQFGNLKPISNPTFKTSNINTKEIGRWNRFPAFSSPLIRSFATTSRYYRPQNKRRVAIVFIGRVAILIGIALVGLILLVGVSTYQEAGLLISKI